MAEIYAQKIDGALWAVDAVSQDHLTELQNGVTYKCVITKPRNYKFLRKFFALLKFAFEHWDIDETENRHGAIVKNFPQFREDVTIQCGYYEQVFRTDGTFRVVAKSIRFASMKEEEFSQLYKSASQVILSKILTKYTQDDLDRVVNEVLRFG